MKCGHPGGMRLELELETIYQLKADIASVNTPTLVRLSPRGRFCFQTTNNPAQPGLGVPRSGMTIASTRSTSAHCPRRRLGTECVDFLG